VATVEEALELGAWGVDGVTTEAYATLAPALEEAFDVRAA